MNIFIKHKKLTILIGAVLGVLVVALVTVGILLLVSNHSNTTKESETTPSTAEKATQHLKQATTLEQAGETQKALESYRQAYTTFKESGDEAGAQGAQLQITYLEQLLTQEKENQSTQNTEPAEAPQE